MIFIVSVHEVQELIYRKGESVSILPKYKKKKIKMVKGKVYQKRKVIDFFCPRYKKEIYSTIKRMRRNVQLIEFEGNDRKMYLLLPQRFIDKLERDGKSRFTEYINFEGGKWFKRTRPYKDL